MKLCIVYGTRPEYLKILPLLQLLKCKSIRILQHTDIVEDIDSDYCIQIETTSNNRLDSLGSQILKKLGPLLDEFTHVLVQGDTSATFYSALCAFQNHKKVIHLEAGLRTYDISKPYPEEGYRQMISRIADIHLCPHQSNVDILRNEKVYGEIHLVGNTILDLVKSYNLEITKGNTVLITFHRRENIEYLDSFIKQLNTCIQSNPDKEFIWVMHPNKELQQKVENTLLNCKFLKPCSHREFLEYVKTCYCILTDSGGIQEECAFLGKPIIVLRHYTERDQIKEPYLFIVKPPYIELKSVFEVLPKTDLTPCHVYGDGYTSEKIINILKLNEG